MESAKKKWAPNPYSIAQLLVDDLDVDTLFDADGKSVDQKLRDALRVEDKQRSATEVFQLFQQITQLVERPTTLAAVMALEPVKKAIEIFGVNQLQRLLPYLVPLADALFLASDSTPGQSSAPGWFKDSGALLIDDASYLDPIQGAVGDCYLVSVMIALAWSKPEFWSARLTSSGFNPPSQSAFQWQFHGEEDAATVNVKVTGRVPVAGKNTPRYARAASGESWPGLIEKACVMKARPAGAAGNEPSPADYQAIDRGATPPRACQMLVGGNVRGKLLDTRAGAKIFSTEGDLHTATGIMKQPVMAWTKEDIGVTDPQVWEKTGLWPNHAYAVLGTMTSDHVVLRNPHGVATEIRAGYAEGPWRPDGRDAVPLNQKGVFAISPEVFFKHFDNIGWVELD
ncbi:MAG: C2 family cysteine protease [Burkholderiaceae bacterium]